MKRYYEAKRTIIEKEKTALELERSFCQMMHHVVNNMQTPKKSKKFESRKKIGRRVKRFYTDEKRSIDL